MSILQVPIVQNKKMIKFVQHKLKILFAIAATYCDCFKIS